MDGDDDEETGYSSSNEYNDTGYHPGNEGSDSDCNRVCEFCTRPNPNCCEFLVCCCKECFRTNGREHEPECDKEWVLKRLRLLPEHRRSLMLLKIGFRGHICRFRLRQDIRFRQDLEFGVCTISDPVLGQDLEFVQYPEIVWKRADNPYRLEIDFRSWRLTCWMRSWKRRKFQQELALKLLKVVFRSWRLSPWEPVD